MSRKESAWRKQMNNIRDNKECPNINCSNGILEYNYFKGLYECRSCGFVEEQRKLIK